MARSALQRLRLAAAANNVKVRDEGSFVVLVAEDHPHGLGVAVEVRDQLYVRLPDELADEEVSTIDADVAIEWTRSL